MKPNTIVNIMTTAIGATGLLMLLDGSEARGLDAVTAQKIAGAAFLLLAAHLSRLARKAERDEKENKQQP